MHFFVLYLQLSWTLISPFGKTTRGLYITQQSIKVQYLDWDLRSTSFHWACPSWAFKYIKRYQIVGETCLLNIQLFFTFCSYYFYLFNLINLLHVNVVSVYCLSYLSHCFLMFFTPNKTYLNFRFCSTLELPVLQLLTSLRFCPLFYPLLFYDSLHLHKLQILSL